jgi:hypothetical protein
MNKWCSKVIPSQTISPNSTFSDNNSLEVISYKIFPRTKNFIFFFHVWKLLPFNFSILKAQEVDAIIVSKTMLDNKTPKNLKWQNARKTKNTPNVSKLSRLIESSLHFSYPSKGTMFWYHVETWQQINEKIEMIKTLNFNEFPPNLKIT